jgi:N-acetylglucosamine-6-phosphate deacetylase
MIGKQHIEVNGRRATLVDNAAHNLAGACGRSRSTMHARAGSVSSLDYCTQRMHTATACSMADAITCATLHPATLLGMQNDRGHLGAGAVADVNVLDDRLMVKATFVAGQLAYTARAGLVYEE